MSRVTQRGFSEQMNANVLLHFDVGRLYRRQSQIHKQYGGQRQGGISTPADYPAVFLFTGQSGEQYGYEDGWSEDGVFQYVGEGQTGDMQFVRGNRAIRDHVSNGKELLLFKYEGKGKSVRFVGEFSCASWEYRKGNDRNGQARWIIVFNLLPVDSGANLFAESGIDEEPQGKSIETLRKEALLVAQKVTQGQHGLAKKTYYKRSLQVRRYVLARANGTCEACDKHAPFVTARNFAYLEPHNVRRVSDGGPDHPRWVAAVCPNCHREAHCGKNQRELNQELTRKLGELEKKLADRSEGESV